MKNMHDNEWSGELFKYAKQNQNINELEIHIDGPYGRSWQKILNCNYNHIVLIAGGIGITPCHSIFSSLLYQYEQKLQEMNDSYIPNIDLFWIVRSKDLFNIFLSTWQSYERNINSNKFNLHFYVSSRIPSESANIEKYIPNTRIKYEYGRPNINEELAFLQHSNNNYNLVFACGPHALVQDANQAATQFGAHFFEESFEF